MEKWAGGPDRDQAMWGKAKLGPQSSLEKCTSKRMAKALLYGPFPSFEAPPLLSCVENSNLLSLLLVMCVK